MATFEELTAEDLYCSSLEGNRLQHFLERVRKELVVMDDVTVAIYDDDPWQTLEGFQAEGWIFIPASSTSITAKGHLVWEGSGSPNFEDLADALHRHFRNSL